MNDQNTSNVDIVYIKTNYLMAVETLLHGNYRFATPYKAKQRHKNDPAGPALIPCYLGAHAEELITINHEYKKLQEQAMGYDTLKKLNQVSNKEEFIALTSNPKELKRLKSGIEELVWGKTLYETYNVLSSPTHGEIAIRGEFNKLSNAMMIAQMQRGGFVNVEFDPQTFQSEISYQQLKQTSKQFAEKKLSLVPNRNINPKPA
jgi:hypothetical protein